MNEINTILSAERQDKYRKEAVEALLGGAWNDLCECAFGAVEFQEMQVEYTRQREEGEKLHAEITQLAASADILPTAEERQARKEMIREKKDLLGVMEKSLEIAQGAMKEKSQQLRNGRAQAQRHIKMAAFAAEYTFQTAEVKPAPLP